MGLLITFGLGVFVLLGMAIAGKAKNEERIRALSIAVALGAITVLLLFDLIPEVIEGIEHIGLIWTIAGIALGFLVLVVLDRFLPESQEAHDGEHEHDATYHISTAVVIALTLHNIIEGMSVYGVATESVISALLLAFGIGIHNIPMGMIVYSGVRGKSFAKRLIVVLFATLSTFVGGLIMFALGSSVDGRVVHFVIAVTVGLLLYIVICELIPNIAKTHSKVLAAAGIASGAIVVLIGIVLAAMA